MNSQQSSTLTTRGWSILLGNGLDHFDMVLYAFLAPLMAPKFFPDADQTVQLVYMYSILAGSAFTRPLGSVAFGWLATRKSAPFSLKLSLVGVGCNTFLIGLLPSHAMLGWISPVLLILLRALQGVFSAGENTVARFFLQEGQSGAKGKKLSAAYHTSTMIGIILGSFIAAQAADTPLVGPFESWRLCFLSGGITASIALFFRLGKQPSSSFLSKTTPSLQPLGVFRLFLTPLFYAIVLIYGLSYATYAFPFIFMNAFVPLVTCTPYDTMLELNTILLVVDLGLILCLGRWLQRFKTQSILKISTLLLAISTPIFFSYLPNASLLCITGVRFLIILLGVAFNVQLNYYLESLLAAEKKYLIGGVADALGTSLLGRTTPAICLGLWHLSQSSMITGLYLAVLSFAVFTSLLFSQRACKLSA